MRFDACSQAMVRQRKLKLVVPVGPTKIVGPRRYVGTACVSPCQHISRQVWHKKLTGFTRHLLENVEGPTMVPVCTPAVGATSQLPSAQTCSMLRRGDLSEVNFFTCFMVAFNKDVDLYESLTWVRAYENYVNLVAVNHGRFGGSFLWTPRRSQGRELARLRGGGLFLVADVDVPVMELLERQRSGVQEAVDAAACSWSGTSHPLSEFKSPPPGFERLALFGPQD